MTSKRVLHIALASLVAVATAGLVAQEQKPKVSIPDPQNPQIATIAQNSNHHEGSPAK